MKIKAYTDGACKGNPGPGGWGWYALVSIDNRIFKYKSSDGNKKTTNQQMELMAMVEFLEFCPLGSNVKIRSDSKYVLGGIIGTICKKDLLECGKLSRWFAISSLDDLSKGWMENWIQSNVKIGTPLEKYWSKSNVSNEKEWRRIHQRLLVLIKNNTKMKFGWCKGHSKIEGNEIADELATKAAKSVY